MSSMTVSLRVPLDGPALSAPGRISLTHDGLQRQVENVARTLAAWGLGPPGRVALLARQTPETAVAIAGLTATMTCAPLNPGLRATEYDFLLGDLDVAALVTPAGNDSPALAVARARG